MIEVLEQTSAKSGSVSPVAEPKTLSELFLRSLAEFDLPDALNYKKDGEWKNISSAELVRRAENIALGLYSLGLRKGDRAAILAANSPEWILADAGCQFAGVIDVPVYTTLTPDSVRYIVDDSAARIMFLQDIETYERIAPAIGDCVSVEKIVLFAAAGVDDARIITLEQLEAVGAGLNRKN